MRAVTAAHHRQLDELAAAYLGNRYQLEQIDRTELVDRLAAGDVVVIDVRPLVEFAAGHISGARSIPVDQLAANIKALPAGVEVVAYCRGPYCVLADDAVRLLRRRSGVVNVLVILQGPAYGDERAYNGLPLAGNLSKRVDVDVRIFCFGNAVACAMAGQQLPNGYYHLDRMITSAARHGAVVGLCGSCMDARGITDEIVIADARRSSLDEVTDWALWADKTITF